MQGVDRRPIVFGKPSAAFYPTEFKPSVKTFLLNNSQERLRLIMFVFSCTRVATQSNKVGVDRYPIASENYNSQSITAEHCLIAYRGGLGTSHEIMG